MTELFFFSSTQKQGNLQNDYGEESQEQGQMNKRRKRTNKRLDVQKNPNYTTIKKKTFF